MKNVLNFMVRSSLISGLLCFSLAQGFAQQPKTTARDTTKPGTVVKDPIEKNNPDNARVRVGGDTLPPNSIGERPASENNLGTNKRTDDKSLITSAPSYRLGSTDNPGSIIQNWPESAKMAATAMMAKYGQPAVSTEDMLIWKDNGVWKKSVVTREETAHDFPKPHKDVLEQTVAYKVPLQMYDELANFDGSITVNRTKGTLSARCDKEAFNILALNLAHEIISGRRSAESARNFLAQTVAEYPNGDNINYTVALMFRPETTETGDPDRPTSNNMKTGSAQRSTKGTSAQSGKREIKPQNTTPVTKQTTPKKSGN